MFTHYHDPQFYSTEVKPSLNDIVLKKIHINGHKIYTHIGVVNSYKYCVYSFKYIQFYSIFTDK